MFPRVRVFTIGHSNHSAEEFRALLRTHDVQVLVDVRSQPYSRWPQFKRKELQAMLRQAGIHYAYAGKQLGGHPDDPALMNGDQPDYDAMARTPAFLDGLDRLQSMLDERRVAIMCAEADPAKCHREALIARSLRERGIDVLHILRDGNLASEATSAPVLPLKQDQPPTEAELRSRLRSVFGFDEFRPGQMEIIEPLLRGESVLGMMPTGAGKSACYQLPALFQTGTTVVVSPLIALMKDQVDGLPPELHAQTTLLNSTLEPEIQGIRRRGIAEGRYRLVYLAPERLRQQGMVQALQAANISLFVIDEAHCVSLWGHDFRPDYLFLRRVFDDLGRPTVLGLTASATPAMQQDVAERLGVNFRHVNRGTYRPNLAYEVQRCGSAAEKWEALLPLVREAEGSVIIYVSRRRDAEQLAEKLTEAGVPAAYYHAGRQRDEREQVQDAWMRGEPRVVCATVAFGMGVDKPDVRLVLHWMPPSSLEAYYQEAGRAGRDGLPARCVLFRTPHDSSRLTRLAEYSRAEMGGILNLLQEMRRLLRGGSGQIHAGDLTRALNTDATRVRVGIGMLESLGLLERGYDEGGRMSLALSPDDADAPAQVQRLIQELETRDADRLATLDGYLKSKRCRQAVIAEYFGSPLDKDCGRCDNCVGATAAHPVQVPLDDLGDAIFERLRAWRREEARRLRVPAYVIMHDRTLRAIARSRPQSLAALEAMPGLGPVKVDRFGERILSTVAATLEGSP